MGMVSVSPGVAFPDQLGGIADFCVEECQRQTSILEGLVVGLGILYFQFVLGREQLVCPASICLVMARGYLRWTRLVGVLSCMLGMAFGTIVPVF